MEFERRNHARAEATSFCHYLLTYQAHQAYRALLAHQALFQPLVVWSVANTSLAYFQHMLRLTLRHPILSTYRLRHLVFCGLDMGRRIYQLACQCIGYLAWYRGEELGRFRRLSLFRGVMSCFYQTKPYLITCFS